MPTESLAVVATGFSVFALVIVVALAVQVGRLRRAYDALVAGDDSSSFVTSVRRHTASVRELRSDVQRLRGDLAGRGAGSTGISRVALVRYDAFGDLAGALSFSAALLDDAGTGLVLSSINGRSETRTYAKGVTAGTGDVPLSPEELEAVAEALQPASPSGTSSSNTASAEAPSPVTLLPSATSPTGPAQPAAERPVRARA